jgi:hypothetical protein
MADCGLDTEEWKEIVVTVRWDHLVCLLCLDLIYESSFLETEDGNSNMETGPTNGRLEMMSLAVIVH